jgi:hypothetical protein
MKRDARFLIVTGIVVAALVLVAKTKPHPAPATTPAMPTCCDGTKDFARDIVTLRSAGDLVVKTGGAVRYDLNLSQHSFDVTAPDTDIEHAKALADVLCDYRVVLPDWRVRVFLIDDSLANECRFKNLPLRQ